MVGQAVPCYIFPFGARSAVVAVWVNGNTAAWCKFAPHFDIFWIHEFDKIFHNDIDTVLVEIPMIAETEQIQLQSKKEIEEWYKISVDTKLILRKNYLMKF